MLTAHAYTHQNVSKFWSQSTIVNNLFYIAPQQQLSYYPVFDYLKKEKKKKLNFHNKTSPTEPGNFARTCIPPRTRYPGQNQATLLGQGASVKTR